MRDFSWGTAARISITLLTFGAVLWWAGPRDVVAAFSDVIWFWLIISIVPYVASLWIQAYRWKLFLGLEAITTDTNRLFRRIWMSRFFAHMLPGSIGGDIFRVIESGDFSNTKMGVARSVLLDRVVALVSLALYTSIACLVWAWISQRAGLGWFASIGLAGSVLALLLLGSNRLSRMARWCAERLQSGRVRNFLSQLANSLSDLAGQRFLLLSAALLTILFNTAWAISSYFGFLALGVIISPLLVITLLPVVYAVAKLPISINGIGVAESLFVVVFVALGLQPSDAAAVAVLLRVKGLVQSAFGGMLYLIERRRITAST